MFRKSEQNFLKYNELCMKIFGMRSFNGDNSPRIMKILGRSYQALFPVLILHVLIPCVAKSFILLNSDIKTFVGSFSDLLVYICVLMQFSYFKINEKVLVNLTAHMHEKFRLQSAPGVITMTIFTSLDLSKKLFIYWFIGCMLSGSVAPILSAINLGDSVNATKSLPVLTWYPFEIYNSRRFYFVYTAQAIAEIYNGVLFALVDAFFLCVIVLICGQFEILKCSLRNLRFATMLSNKKINTDHAKFSQRLEEFDSSGQRKKIFQKINTINQDVETRQFLTVTYDKQFYNAVKDCIQHHQDILKFCDIIGEFLSPLLFAKLVYISIFLCIQAYQTSTTNDVYKIINHLEYIGIVTTELFLFTYMGQILTEKSITVGDAIYEETWYTFNSKTKKMLQMIILRSQHRPVILHGLKFFNLTTATFINILRASFSYYTLLKSMNK